MSTVYTVFFGYHDDWEFIGCFKNKRAALKGKKQYLDSMEPYRSKTFDRAFYEQNTVIQREKVRS